MTKTNTPYLVVLDEYGYYAGNSDDNLKEELRSIVGVPNATYVVKGDRVFVFDKLVKLVKEQQKGESTVSLADMARALLEEATISPEEAVETWAIVPEPYEMKTISSGGFRIWHRAFQSWLPGIFASTQEVQRVFSSLLLGEIQSGMGDFVYRGQSMELCEPIDISLLPPRPVIECGSDQEDFFYTSLQGITYQLGFEPVSEDIFNGIKEREFTWKKERVIVTHYVRRHSADLWGQAATLRLETLNYRTDDLMAHDLDDVAALRSCYPELSMLSDGSLYAWFDVYQMDCGYCRGWTANRDDGFLWYLLGNIGQHQHEDLCNAVGKWVGYAILRGEAIDAAFSFGQACAVYERAITNVSRRIANAMLFLEEATDEEQRGSPIRTMTDMFRVGRKFSTSLIPTEQHLADFKAEAA